MQQYRCFSTSCVILLQIRYIKYSVYTRYQYWAEYLDVQETVPGNEDIVPFIVAFPSLSGCNTVAPHHGLGKITVVKRLKDVKKLSNIDHVIKEATLFISDCYGFQQESMTKCCIMPRNTKTSKTRKTTPPLKTLPLTDQSFK